MSRANKISGGPTAHLFIYEQRIIMNNALEKVTKRFKDVIISEKDHCTRVIATENNRQLYIDIYQDVVLAFDGINEQIELKTEEELDNYLASV